MLAPTKDTITANKRTLTHQVQLTLSKISKELLKLSILSRLRSLSMLGIPDGRGLTPHAAVVSPIPRACGPGCPAMPTATVYAIASSLFRQSLTGHACTYVLRRLYQGIRRTQCKTDIVVSLQLKAVRASAHMLGLVMKSPSSLSAQPSRYQDQSVGMQSLLLAYGGLLLVTSVSCSLAALC